MRRAAGRGQRDLAHELPSRHRRSPRVLAFANASAGRDCPKLDDPQERFPMSWVDVLWPMMGAASLTLAVIHAFVFAHQRGALEHLWLVCAALAVAALTILELRGMRTTDPVLFGETLRYAHVPLSALAIALVWMVRARFGAGPVWIAWVVTAVRLASLVPNFATGVDLNFIAVHAMQRIDLLGETLY